jgi:hypothetical protein
VFSQFGPDVLQTDALDFNDIGLPAGVQGWPVLRGDAQPPKGVRVLFEGPRSGTGLTADWTLAARLATRCEMILAGGLSPQNVAEAVRSVRPFGVDVSSGVEESPPHDPARIADFVRTARAVSPTPRNRPRRGHVTAPMIFLKPRSLDALLGATA